MSDSPSVLQRPVVIVGSPRSGTSFLIDVLREHPDLHAVVEPRLLWKWGNDRKSDLLTPADARPNVVRRIRRTLADEVTRAGRPRLAEKTPSNALRLGFVERVLPEMRVVHLIRNGYDSVLSIRSFWQGPRRLVRGQRPGLMRQRLRELGLRRVPRYAGEIIRRLLPGPLARLGRPVEWGPRLPGMSRLVREMDVLDACCLQWRMCVEMAAHYGREMPAERYMECRIEEMSPEALRRILEFCELPEHAAVWAAFHSKRDGTDPGERRRQADPAELARIRRWIEPTMHWLGYPVEP